ncbi:hypothetical protein C5167_011221 [Papaver somniferum]|uniref:Uncharacterized protein n=1 Tax=Papaver somniferum TaxID=3469 RepID=A0A4Y7K3Y3_PAPSO|nr:hypothetical protein C5167_011221 [Papaver somniferum]
MTSTNCWSSYGIDITQKVGVEVMYDIVCMMLLLRILGVTRFISKASIGVASAVGDFGCPTVHAVKNNDFY